MSEMLMAADTLGDAAERKRLEYIFNSLQKAMEHCRSLEMMLDNTVYHSTQPEVRNPTKPGNYPSWEAMTEDLKLSVQDVRKELAPAYRDVAQRLYGLNPNV